MSDGMHTPAAVETGAQRRARITAQVRTWCEEARIGDTSTPVGIHRELSAAAALLIAAGYLDEPTRAVLAARRLAGRGLPDVGGFGDLRLLTDDYVRLDRKAAGMRPGAMQALTAHRAGELGRRLQAARSRFVHSPPHHANGVRTIRRDRRDGVHLELPQREALFAALQRTPTPLNEGRGPADQATSAALAAAADRLAGLTERTPWAAMGRRAADALGGVAGQPGDRFVDRFDALLFLAGTLFDRIDGSVAWHSEHFAIQRVQLDLAEELTQIAVDAVALRGIGGELFAASNAARTEAARTQIRARQRALVPVWDQLVDRVAALARIGDLLADAEDQLQSMAAVQRTMSLDSRIDELIARSGSRELSADNIHFVGDQIGGVDELMISYQNLLHGDILALRTRPGRDG
ncbi:hypothetical protein FK531_21210 [Rhodococcus spelaei]|uniref:Uncharacterized protein n=1 Tax=Rhodococcus spelaei TaxID=2546320 RepID=A0A541AZX8_9NOCA|nr:hypothetical protein [Rhodococcus spelaei]TQF65616.1 hypothetical protein FK531_21210 [Rhodococcus spelaei]